MSHPPKQRRFAAAYQEKKTFCRSPAWVRIRDAAIKRAQFTCEHCGKVMRDGKGFAVHHQVPFEIAPEYRLVLANLKVLCIACHKWTHSKANTERLYLYFTKEEFEKAMKA